MQNSIEKRSGKDRRTDERTTSERRQIGVDLETATFKATGKSFEIRSIDTNEDGSVDLALELDDDTKKLLCKTFGWAKVTEEHLQTLVIDALNWHLKKSGGDKASTVNEEQQSAAE
mgnify:CR=1 FL=1